MMEDDKVTMKIFHKDLEEYEKPPEVKEPEEKPVLKEGDTAFISRVISYLEEQNLDVEIVGSAKKGNKKYNDVDLLIKGSQADVIELYDDLLFRLTRESDFETYTTDGGKFDSFKTHEPGTYAGTNINVRYEIIFDGTKVDMSIKII